MGKFVFFLSLLSVVVVGFGIYEGLRFYRSEFPNVAILKHQYPVLHRPPPTGTTDPDSEDDEPAVTFQKARPAGWVSLSEVSKVATGAILVSEDWAFYQHKGYDPKQIKEAIKEDWEQRRFARGASTITQQVAKNVFLEKDKNLWRKIKELYLAVQLEETVGKRKILETYLNVAEWGYGIYGISAASERYFNKSPKDLTAKEGAFLAMLLPSPKRYSQSFRAKRLTDYGRETVGEILDKMTQAHYLNDSERTLALATPLSFENPAAEAF